MAHPTRAMLARGDAGGFDGGRREGAVSSRPPRPAGAAAARARTMSDLSDASTQNAEATRVYLMRRCPSCAYPATMTSRDDEGRVVCPECGTVLGIRTMETGRVGAIADAYHASRFARTRAGSVGALVGYLVFVPFLSRFDMSGVLLTLFYPIIGGTLLLLVVTHMLIGLRLERERCGRSASRLHAAWWVLLLSAVLLALTGLIYTEMELLFAAMLSAGIWVLAWDASHAAARFPVDETRESVLRHARTSARLGIGLGALLVLSVLLGHWWSDEPWDALVLLLVADWLLYVLLYAKSLRRLRADAGVWLDPIDLTEHEDQRM